MKKILFPIIIFCLVLIPLKGEIALNLGAVYSGAFSIDNYTYSTSWSDNGGIVSFLERNSSTFSGKGGVGFNAGLSFFFNYKIGIGLTVSSLKTKFNILNSFNWHFQWWNGTSVDITPKNWSSEGSVSVLPVSVNLIFRLISKENLKLNLFVGPTVFFTSPNLTGNGGYADGPYEFNGTYYIDWYDLPLDYKSSKTLFGGNGGIELEYFFSESMAVYLSGAYYFAGNSSDIWTVKTGQYTGEFGNLVGTISKGDILPGYNVNVKVSTFTLGIGIKVYL